MAEGRLQRCGAWKRREEWGSKFFAVTCLTFLFFLCRFVIRKLALFFAIVGTVMWALSTTEFSLMSKLKNMWKVRHNLYLSFFFAKSKIK